MTVILGSTLPPTQRQQGSLAIWVGLSQAFVVSPQGHERKVTGGRPCARGRGLVVCHQLGSLGAQCRDGRGKAVRMRWSLALGSGGTGESVRPVCHKEGPLWGLGPTTTSLPGWTLLLTLQHRHLHEGLATEMALRVMALSCDTKHGIPGGGPHTETWHKHTAPGYSPALPCPPTPLYPLCTRTGSALPAAQPRQASILQTV